MRLVQFIFVFSIIMYACSSTSKDNTKEKIQEDKTPTHNIPIYEQYEDLAYIFEQHNDTTYIINFWATWCKPCVAELPYFEQLHTSYSGQKVKVILVSLDFKKQIDKKLIPFIEKNKIQSKVLLLADGKSAKWIDQVEPKWDGAIPITIIYKGENRAFVSGEVDDYEQLNSIVQTIINS